MSAENAVFSAMKVRAVVVVDISNPSVVGVCRKDLSRPEFSQLPRMSWTVAYRSGKQAFRVFCADTRFSWLAAYGSSAR